MSQFAIARLHYKLVIYTSIFQPFKACDPFSKQHISVAQWHYIFSISEMFSLLVEIEIRSCGPPDLCAVAH